MSLKIAQSTHGRKIKRGCAFFRLKWISPKGGESWQTLTHIRHLYEGRLDKLDPCPLMVLNKNTLFTNPFPHMIFHTQIIELGLLIQW